jgi:hypothetical protein
VGITNITKIKEDTYAVTSAACPECKEPGLTAHITGAQMFLYHQGAMMHEVFADHNADTRERFISGFCAPCWDKMFAFDE